MRRNWTPAEDAALTARYPHESAQAIADSLGRGVRAVYMRANLLGLKKSEGWASECTRQRWAEGRHENSRAQLAKGRAWNKGKPLAEWNPNARAFQASQFKKGEVNGIAAERMQPIGAMRVAAGQLIRKVNNDTYRPRRWVPVSRLVWEAANGPVPAGHVVRFREGRATVNESEITLDRLELVSRRENMLRNSRHNRYPPELNALMQLQGALNRKINNRSKA